MISKLATTYLLARCKTPSGGGRSLSSALLPVVLLLCASVEEAAAQEVRKVQITYDYVVPETISIGEGRRVALERAQAQAIADEFGSSIEVINRTDIVNSETESSVRFLQSGGSEVKGEWIETLSQPVYTLQTDGQKLVIRVTVSGRIRSIDRARVEIDARALRNGRTPANESDRFKSGDLLYLHFQAPIDGFLTVYLFDTETDEVYCLLPAKGSDLGAFPIEHDRPYVLFERKGPQGITSDYYLTCESEQAENQIYVLFSKNDYTKALASENGRDEEAERPLQLSYERFQQWLTRVKRHDADLVERRLLLNISR